MSFALSPKLAAVVCLMIPFLAAAIGFIIRRASPRYTDMQNSLDGLNNRVNETITNERVIKSLCGRTMKKRDFPISING